MCQKISHHKQLTQYQLLIKNPPAESALHKTFLPRKIKTKSVLKIIKQPPREDRPKQPFKQENKQNTSERPMKELTFTKTADMQPPDLLEMRPHGNSQSKNKTNTYFKEKPLNSHFKIYHLQ